MLPIADLDRDVTVSRIGRLDLDEAFQRFKGAIEREWVLGVIKRAKGKFQKVVPSAAVYVRPIVSNPGLFGPQLEKPFAEPADVT